MGKHARKRRLWLVVAAAAVLAAATGGATTFVGGSGQNATPDAAVQLAASTTIYGCARSAELREIFDKSVTSHRCPAGSHRVSWHVKRLQSQSPITALSGPAPDPTSPAPDPGSPAPDPGSPAPDPGSPAPDTSSPAPDTSSPAPDTSSPAASECVTSDAQGICNFGPDSQITGASSDPWVGQDVWNPISGWQQTLYATSPGDWYAVANIPAGNTEVVSFPNVAAYYSNAPSQYSVLTSSFDENMNATSGTNAEASYDMWFNDSGTVNEVMIQNDYSPGRAPSCDNWYATNVSFGGSNGVAARPWDLCVSGSTAYWETADGNFSSGSVDILAMVNWLISKGVLASGTTFSSISYGWEVSSTGGKDETFNMSSFSMTAS